MVRKKRNPGRNRNGGYDLSAAEKATPKRGRSRADSNPESGSGRGAKHSRREHQEAHHGRHGRQRRDDAIEVENSAPAPASTSQNDADADERHAQKQAMREAASLAAAHIAAEESGRMRRQRPQRQQPLPTDAEHSMSSGEQERVSVGYTGPETTAQGHRIDPETASYSKDHYKARPKRTSKRRHKGVIAVVVILLVLIVGAGTAAALWYSGIADSLRGSNKISATVGSDNGEPYYVLLLGGDSRSDNPKDDYGNRTDSIMVARVDEKNKNVSILSIPRDTRVAIDGHGMQKINSAIEFGGYDSTVNEVNELLGIKINYYAFIYFDGFSELVDKLGGVTVKVPEGTYYDGVSVPAGDAVTINGQEALVLARCRHGRPADQGAYAMGDYQRALNQRNLIKAIAKKVLDQDVTKMPDLISSISQCLETNMDVSKIVSLAQNMKGMDVNKIKADTLPYAGSSIDGEWYAIPYEDVFEDVKANFVAGKKPYQGLANYDVETNGDDIGSDYVDGTVYAYTNYEKRYGPYKGKGTPKQLSTASSSSSTTSTSTSTSTAAAASSN